MDRQGLSFACLSRAQTSCTDCSLQQTWMFLKVDRIIKAKKQTPAQANRPTCTLTSLKMQRCDFSPIVSEIQLPHAETDKKVQMQDIRQLHRASQHQINTQQPIPAPYEPTCQYS